VTDDQSTHGQLFIVAAPSGAGKTSLVKSLIEGLPSVKVAVSHTTRPRRPDEIDGVNYHFVSEPKFRTMQAEGAFIESAQVFGNLYGTSRQAIETIISSGHNIILEIDWQGAQQIRRQEPASVHIFILPPSLAALRSRLQGRGQDDPDTIDKRMAEALSELSHYREFDYLIINDNYATALADLARVVEGRGEDLRRSSQQSRHAQLIESLLNPARPAMGSGAPD
jgi:guanylate kinase